MARKKLTKRNARKVFDAVLAAPPDQQKMILEEWNAALDALRDDDAFGTEGQLDPRGDGRED